MVQEDELKYLQNLKEEHPDPSAEWGGEGGSYQAGTGITIEDETISVNAKAGYGIVVDVDETDESLVIMTDDEHIQDKLTAGTGISIDSTTATISVDSSVVLNSDLATVATTGNYNDLINQPTIPTNVTSDSITLDHGQASSYGYRWAQIRTMVGSTAGTQQTGLRFMGTSNNTTSGTPLDFNMLDIRPAKFSLKTPAIEFGSSSAPVSTIDISSGATVKIGTNTVLTDADVVANPATTTGTLTGLTIGSTSYAIPSGTTVSGTNDGTNWTSLTVGADTYAIPQGGSGSGPLVLTAMSGTLTDAQYASLDENTVIEYRDTFGNRLITRLYYFYSDTSTQIEYRTNPIFIDNVVGNAYRFIVTKADKSYGLNYSIGFRLLPVPSDDGTSRLIMSKSGGTVTSPTWKLDYPDPDTTTAGTFNLSATVDSQGGITYDWAAGGSGGGKYLHKVSMWASFGGTTVWFTEDYVNSSSTAYTSALDYLADRGYNITDTTQTLTKYLTCFTTGGLTAIACNASNNSIYTATLSINSSGVIALSTNWAVQVDTVGINDEVIAL